MKVSHRVIQFAIGVRARGTPIFVFNDLRTVRIVTAIRQNLFCV